MKSFLVSLAMMFVFSVIVLADTNYYGTMLSVSNGMTSQSATIDLNDKFCDRFAAQAVYSAGSYSTITASTPTVTTGMITTTNTYATGLAALFTMSGATLPISGLSTNTTYYMVQGSGYIGLASSSANAYAGTTIAFTAISLSTNTFTVAPIPIQASSPFGAQWQGSMDGVDFNNITATGYNVTISSLTILAGQSATSYLWDFGPINYRYIKVLFNPGTFGAANMLIYGEGKRY